MLAPDVVAEIKATAGIYRAADVARHYGVHRSTVKRLWEGERRAGIPKGQVPNINTRPRTEDLYDDIQILLRRGMKSEAVAKTLNISVHSVNAVRGNWL